MSKIHFIAIGGSAMHNLAIALKLKGYQVSGSDDALFEPSKSRLAKYDILPAEKGWFTNKITSDLDAVILGMHAHADNPELAKAKELGLKIYSYPEFLYEESKHQTRVVIAGSHGKTSITAMILHVLNYHKKPTSFMVGAQLEGFEVMVDLNPDNLFMLLEGDEYLSSTLDRRPKIHHYHPNIALLSGIAWDHINVFPTFENYVEQFKIFIDTLAPGGALIYNSEDSEVQKLIDNASNYFKAFPYRTPEHYIDDGITYLDNDFGPVPLEIFGKHNLQNLEGARLICNQMGVQDEAFYEAISSFKGASKRLELINRTKDFVAFKDYAHAPSKVKSTVAAVREQFKNKKLVAFLELHTYSSLNPEFLNQYKGSLDLADEAIVCYNAEALAIKRMEPIDPELIKSKFNREDIVVFDNKTDLGTHFESVEKENTVFLMMSSGNYGGLDLKAIFA